MGAIFRAGSLRARSCGVRDLSVVAGFGRGGNFKLFDGSLRRLAFRDRLVERRTMAGTSFGRYRLVRLLARGDGRGLSRRLDGAGRVRKAAGAQAVLPIYGGLGEFTELFVDEPRISVSLVQHRADVRLRSSRASRSWRWSTWTVPTWKRSWRRSKVEATARARCGALRRNPGSRSARLRALAGHESGRPMAIIHRDVAPNVLLSVSGDVKLTDFRGRPYAMSLSRSRPGVVRGKYAYMSPGGCSETRSTPVPMYSASACCFTRWRRDRNYGSYRLPDDGTGGRHFARAHQSRRPGMPEDLAQVITRCLHRLQQSVCHCG